MKNKFVRSSKNASVGLAVALSVGLAVLACPVFALPASHFEAAIKQPPGMGNAEGLAYAKSEEYKKEFLTAVEDGKKACENYLKEHPGDTNMAVVADIDETVFDNRPYFETTKEFDWDKFVVWVEQSKAPSLKPTADFLDWARKNGFAVFFVTGRPENLRAATIRNMVRNGIAYDGLYLRPNDDKRSAIEVKSAVRKQIEDMGFKIVVNIGDQVSDLVGGYSVDCEKLPNKIYFVE
jgi:5'-nucleotidase (lipoprotein e(P4) family)